MLAKPNSKEGQDHVQWLQECALGKLAIDLVGNNQVHLCVCVCVCVYICLSLYIFVCVYIYVCVCVYIIYVRVYIYIYARVYILYWLAYVRRFQRKEGSTRLSDVVWLRSE